MRNIIDLMVKLKYEYLVITVGASKRRWVP